jgi:hypothetical protein
MTPESGLITQLLTVHLPVSILEQLCEIAADLNSRGSDRLPGAFLQGLE